MRPHGSVTLKTIIIIIIMEISTAPYIIQIFTAQGTYKTDTNNNNSIIIIFITHTHTHTSSSLSSSKDYIINATKIHIPKG